LAHGQNLIDGTQYALDVLSEGDGSALNQLAVIASRLGSLLDYDAQLKEIRDVVASAQAEVQEAAYMLRDYHQRLEIDPARFKDIEQRLDAVHTMGRKWHLTPDDFPDAMMRARERLSDLGADADIETLRAKVAEASETYLLRAKKLTAARKKAAKILSEKVTVAMQTLAMSGGRFEIALNPLNEGNSGGLEQVEFLVSAHRETEVRSLAKVASGGELSRISLALQTVLSEVARVPTMIFDEVDAGIGGGIAEIVGRMLNKLGTKRQVMCVTHLPQVAAAADHQWQVVKTSANGKISSRVAVLDDKQRVEEIARMLGGVKITDTTRQHAAEMLGNAPKSKLAISAPDKSA
jgi:DNA repair protein RecN (Recombination protein N)